MQLVPGVVRSMRWRRAAPAVAGLLHALLAGCVHEGPPVRAIGPRPPADGRDIETASDETKADRLAQTRMDLAAGYLGRNQPTDALDEIKLAIAAKPDSGDAYSLRGLIYAALGDFRVADESFRHARELAPHDGNIMHNYGWFLCQQQRYPEADAEFKRALAEPSYRQPGRTMFAQGVCEARSGHLADADHTLSRAYELDPGNPVVAYNLSEVLYRSGQYDRARFYMRRVNARDDLVSAQSLWLAARIEHKLGADDRVRELGAQLNSRFPQAPETLRFDKGQFDG